MFSMNLSHSQHVSHVPCSRQHRVSQHTIAVFQLHSQRSSSSSMHMPRLCSVTTSAATIDTTLGSSSSSSSTSIELRRKLQHMFEEVASPQFQQQQQQQAEDAYHEPTTAAAAATAGRSTVSHKQRGAGAGFGAGSSSRKTGQKKQQSKAAAAAATASSDAACPCRSGLLYKDCCQPFVTGAAYPKSAPELVRARITAMKTGNVAFLASTVHTDSSMALGGRKDTASRAKQQCALFRRTQCEVVGMAHCRGNVEGSWLVLAILQGAAGEYKGVKVPYMELIVRQSWREPAKGQTISSTPFAQHQERGSSNSGGGNGDRWMFYKQTNELPSNAEGDAIIQLLQQHVPELLLDENERDGERGVVNREVYFNWVAPYFSSSNGSSRSSSSSDWYVDLLTSAAEPLTSSRGGTSSRASEPERQQKVIQQLLVPRGVFVMDEYLQQRKRHA